MQQSAKQHIDRLRTAIKNGSCALLAGYDLSALNAGVPANWKTIQSGIIRWYSAEKLQGRIPETDVEAGTGELVDRKETITTGEVAITLDRYLKDPLIRRRCLRQILHCHETAVSEIHKLIVKLPFKAYLTTNYDTFIEAAYSKESGKALARFYDDEIPDIAIHITTLNDEPFILKLCGDIDRPASLSSDLDLNKRLKDTDHPLKDLHNVITERNVLCIGFDPDNPDYDSLANLCEKVFFKDTNLWIAIHQKQETKFQQNRHENNIHILPYGSLQEFIEQLFSTPDNEIITDLPLPKAVGEVPVKDGSANNVIPLRKTGPLQPQGIAQPQTKKARSQSKKKVTVNYDDFHLHINPSGYISAKSNQGEEHAQISPEIPKALQNILTQIEQPQSAEEDIEKYGLLLYRHIFPSEIHAFFKATVAVARNNQKTVRIRLTIEPKALEAVPWEHIYHERFLAADPDTVLSRYIDLPMPPNYVRQHDGPLHLLVIIANPLPTSSSPTDWETIIRDALKKPLDEQSITIQFVHQATFNNIRDALLEKQPDMLQFIGHGIYKDGKEYLALVDDQTKSMWPLDSKRFAYNFLGFTRTLGLVSLMTYGNENSKPQHSLLNIAPQLVREGVPAVIAMRYSISESTAAIYLGNFYTSIAARRPADWAVQQARNAIYVLRLESGYRELAAPVLYMRAKDGNIFD